MYVKGWYFCKHESTVGTKKIMKLRTPITYNFNNKKNINHIRKNNSCSSSPPITIFLYSSKDLS